MINKGRICKYPGCNHHSSSKGYCINHIKYYYEERKNEKKI